MIDVLRDEYPTPDETCSGDLSVGTRVDNDARMTELVSLVEEAPEGGYDARAGGAAIFTEADDLAELEAQVRAAVQVHLDARERPKLIRLHHVRETLIAV